MTKSEIKAKIMEFFEEHEDVFNEAIESLDSWDGYLGDDRYYPMEELDEFYRGSEPSEILMRAFFGYDADSWHTDAHKTLWMEVKSSREMLGIKEFHLA